MVLIPDVLFTSLVPPQMCITPSKVLRQMCVSSFKRSCSLSRENCWCTFRDKQ